MGVYDLKGEAYLKKILMISTGGTIASTPSDDGLTPTVSGGEMVKLIPELEGLCEITVCDLLNLDSSNMQPEYWVAMASACYTALSTGFDGIVITHGTDTMAYSAAALSFMLMNLNKPVVLTGSQIPIEEPKTDGKRNILDAFRVAADGRLAGVYVVFAGRIVPGYCVRKVYSRDFKTMEAINRRLAGKIVKGEVVLDGNPPALHTAPMALHTDLDPNVLLVKLLPGTRPELLEAAGNLGYKAVVIEAFGLGGIPNVKRNLLPAIEKLIEQGIPVVVTTQCVYEGCDMSVYDVGVEAARAGALSGGTMTPEAIAVKLMWILGHTDDPVRIRELFYKNYVGEISSP
ncbi:MAG: asparaginase [Oscillospiraceae bacterium]|nr:asparaginase [Oscillospiraceae bacterium]